MAMNIELRVDRWVPRCKRARGDGCAGCRVWMLDTEKDEHEEPGDFSAEVRVCCRRASGHQGDSKGWASTY